MLDSTERQVAPELSGIRRDHVARYEWAAAYLGEPKEVIDLACGVGYGAAMLADAGHMVVAIDREPDAIAFARKHYNSRSGLTYKVGDANELMISESLDYSYDAAVCFETIEHLADPLPMLRYLRKAAPVLIASVPNEAVFPHNGRIRHHYRHYTREQFSSLLARAGYKVDAWYGQEGPHSNVAPDVNGRTLIAAAHRGDLPKAIEPKQYIDPRPVPEHVAILGLGPSGMQFFELTRGLGGASAFCDEVWGINALGDVFRCDRIFHMDDLKVQEARGAQNPGGNIAAMVKWLRRHPGPVYTSVVRDGYPGLVAFPLEAVLNAKLDTNGSTPYFNSTAAYAIAYAIHIGVKRISLFGLDYTYPNRHHAEKGRACCEFWLGVAAARGIEITVPDGSSLLDACELPESLLYGYDCVDVRMARRDNGTVAVEMTPREAVPVAAEVEARYDHRKHPNPLMRAVG